MLGIMFFKLEMFLIFTLISCLYSISNKILLDLYSLRFIVDRNYSAGF